MTIEEWEKAGLRSCGVFPPMDLIGQSLDCTGAIACLSSAFPKAELFGIAHSLGAIIFGGATNVTELRRLVLIGAHTGFYGDYLARYRIPMYLLGIA